LDSIDDEFTYRFDDGIIFKNIHNVTSFEGYWMKRNTISYKYHPTPYGVCKTVNLLPNDQMFHATADDSFFKRKEFTLMNTLTNVRLSKMEVTNQLRTSSRNLGFDGFLYSGQWFFIDRSNQEGAYRIMFHPPHEIPSENSRQFFITLNEGVKFMITPQLKRIDDSLIQMTSNSRNCYRDEESRNLLKFFKVYSEENCRQEHLSEFIEKTCGCVPFYMIRET
jgi:hypothetical protein